MELDGHVFAITAICGLFIFAVVFLRPQPPPAENGAPQARARARSRASTFDFTDAVDRAHHILPAVKNFLKEILIHRFLSNWYAQELGAVRASYGEGVGWSAVAHSSPPSKSISYDQECPNFRLYPTMNVAFPDLSAEYYLTFVPKSSAPIFHVRFPDWVVYGALTMYDSYGIPMASVNMRQLKEYVAERQVTNADVNPIKKPVFSKLNLVASNPASEDYGKVSVNLFKGCSYSGDCVVVCRFYRPSDVDIVPRVDLPAVFFIERGDAQSFHPCTTLLRPLLVASREESFEAGKRIEAFFSKLIVGKLKEPTPDHYGCQFFHPQAVVGCFPNADAVYVLAWKPSHMHGMKVTLRVPFYADYRPYYGIMCIDHHSTATLSSLTYEELGGWGASCTVFVAITEVDAVLGGYQKSEKSHKLLLWGEGKQGPFGVVVRYIHFLEENLAAQATPGHMERQMLIDLDGTDDGIINSIPGLGQIIFY